MIIRSSPYNDLLSLDGSDMIKVTAIKKGIRGHKNYDISKDSAPYFRINSPKRLARI